MDYTKIKISHIENLSSSELLSYLYDNLSVNHFVLVEADKKWNEIHGLFKRLNGSRIGKNGSSIPVNIIKTNKSMALPGRLEARALMAKLHNVLSIEKSLSEFLKVSGFKTSDYILTKRELCIIHSSLFLFTPSHRLRIQ